MTVRTRFAPSPTGFLHIGGLRTALFCWLYARRHGGVFVLRIEDTDLERSTPEAIQQILDGMEWAGLNHDEGPFYQTRRFDRYREVIDELLVSGHAYRCYCTREELDQMRADQIARGQKPRYDGRWRDRTDGPAGVPFVVRFRNPADGDVVVDDVIHGRVVFQNSELDDLIIARSDGTPTYNFCVVVDDMDMQITHVIRGDDHLNNTPRQQNMLLALGHKPPVYAHLPMILGADGAKLSKRHGAVSVLQYRDEGFLPEAVLNYLVRLGWSHGDQEIFSLAGLKEVFSLEALGKSASVFNPEKLLWLNAHYIKETPVSRLAGLLNDVLSEQGQPSGEVAYLEKIIPLLQARSQTIVEMATKVSCFLADDDALPIDAEAAAKFLTPEIKEHLEAIRSMLSGLEGFGHAELETAFHAYIEAKTVKFKVLAQPIRVALTGSTASPGLFEMMEVMGKQRVLARLQRAEALC